MLVHIIADYGTGDLAFAEVVQRIKLHLPDAEPIPVPVPPIFHAGRRFLYRSTGSQCCAAWYPDLSQRCPARGRPSGPTGECGRTLGLCTASYGGSCDRRQFWLCSLLHQRCRGEISVGSIPGGRQPVPFAGRLSAGSSRRRAGTPCGVGRRDRRSCTAARPPPR